MSRLGLYQDFKIVPKILKLKQLWTWIETKKFNYHTHVVYKVSLLYLFQLGL